jgi:hypothetical protein
MKKLQNRISRIHGQVHSLKNKFDDEKWIELFGALKNGDSLRSKYSDDAIEIEKNKETEIAPVTEGQESHQINADGEGSAKEQYQALRDHHKKEDEGSEEAEEVEEISDEDESGEHGFYEDYKIEHLLDIKA